METKDVPLSSVLQDDKKLPFITRDKITLAFCELTRIDRIFYPLNKVSKLHLSHNKIVSLDGIEQFQSLEQLSLSYNRIEGLQEFYKVNNRYRLKELSVRGNPLEHHPNYIYSLVEIFPSVVRIDDLTIDHEDRKYLRNFERFSGLIIPFCLSMQRDQEVLNGFLSRISELYEAVPSQRERASGSASAVKLIDELKEQLSYPELLSALERQARERKNWYLTAERSPLSMLSSIVSLITGLYPNFDHIGEEKSPALYEMYKVLFNEVMIQYHGQSDKTLDMFLTTCVLKSRSYDLEHFANDSMYAFECILLEFYKLMPSQAFFTENVMSQGQNLTTESRNEPFQSSDDAGATQSTPRSPLDVEQSDPEYLKTLWLSHFPLFPLNKQYLNCLNRVLRARVGLLRATFSEAVTLLDKVYSSNTQRGQEGSDILTFSSVRTQDADAGVSIGEEQERMGHGDALNSAENRGDKQSTLRMESGTIGSQMGYSTRDSIGFNDRFDGTRGATSERISEGNAEEEEEEEDEELEADDDEYERQAEEEARKNALWEEKSILPILLFVKINDRVQTLQYKFLDALKRTKPIDPRTLHYKRLPNEEKSTLRSAFELFEQMSARSAMRTFLRKALRLKQVQDFLVRQDLHRKRTVFRAFELARQNDNVKADAIYHRILYLRTFYSILKTISRKRAILTKLLTRLTGQTNTVLTFHLAKWRMITRAMGYLTTRNPSKSFKRGVQFKDNQNPNPNPTDLPSRPQPQLSQRSHRDTSRDRTTRMDELRAYMKGFDRKYNPDPLYVSYKNHIFRKCTACDTPGYHYH